MPFTSCINRLDFIRKPYLVLLRFWYFTSSIRHPCSFSFIPYHWRPSHWPSANAFLTLSKLMLHNGIRAGNFATPLKSLHAKSSKWTFVFPCTNKEKLVLRRVLLSVFYLEHGRHHASTGPVLDRATTTESEGGGGVIAFDAFIGYRLIATQSHRHTLDYSSRL